MRSFSWVVQVAYPKVREMLEGFFGNKPICDWIHPEESVAYGAAVHSAMLKGLRDATRANVRLSLSQRCVMLI